MKFAGANRFCLRKNPVEKRCGLINQQVFLRRLLRARWRLVILLILGGRDRDAEFATAIRAERPRERRADRHHACIAREHLRPRRRLHQIPVRSRGEKPRDQRQDDGKFPMHRRDLNV